MPRRLKPAHYLLSQSGRLVRVLRPIVQSLVLAVLDTRHDLSLRRTVALQLVGDDHARDVLQTFQQLAEELLRG